MRSFRRLLVGLLLVLVPPVSCAQNTGNTEDGSEQKTASTSPSSDQTGGSSGTDSSSKKRRLEIVSQLPDVVDEALPSVVGVSTQKVIERRRSPFPFDQQHPLFRGLPFGPGQPGGEPPTEQRKKRGIGSGVIVSKDGQILTSAHVVEGADDIKVSLSEHEEYDAKIVGTDKATDIAVLKIENPPGDLNPIEIGDSSRLKLGEPVVAIGNPFGLSGSVTYGIVSAKGRANVGLTEYEDFIQTDAAINPGNSGGALVNMEGELIGINTAILSRSGGYQGIGFAIPSNMAESVMKKLQEDGVVERGWLGVYIQTLTPELAEAFDLKKDRRGVVVSKVVGGSPADEAGLKRGDVVIGFEGKKIEDSNTLRNQVARQSPGEKVQITVIRDGHEKTLTIELGARRKARGSGPGQVKGTGILKGLVLENVGPETSSKFNLPDRLDKGVVVTDIEPGTPAARTGLRPGDVILEVNRSDVKSVDQFMKLYRRAEDRVLLLLYRDGGTLFMAVPKQPGR